MNSTTNDTLLDSTGMTNYEYRVALMLFLVAYSLFEAPSNLAMKIFKPNMYVDHRTARPTARDLLLTQDMTAGLGFSSSASGPSAPALAVSAPSPPSQVSASSSEPLKLAFSPA